MAYVVFMLFALVIYAEQLAGPLDQKFLKIEINRNSQKTSVELIDEISNYIKVLHVFGETYRKMSENKSDEDVEKADEIWKKFYQSQFQDSYNKALITSFVCEDLYAFMTCTLPEELWNEKIDSRSRVTLRDAIMQIRAALQTEEFFEIKEQAREKMTKLTDL